MRYAVCAGLLLISLLGAQETRIPTTEEVRLLQGKFRKERDSLLQTGAAKRFLPILLDKADEMGQRADKALAEGRLLQASELYRQARWQLPYQSPQVPDKHVARILGNLRLRHSQEINDVAFSPDGKRLATASRDRTVKLWDLENGHELRSYHGHSDSVRRLAFSPDGRLVASAGAERDIKLWDPATGQDVRTIKGQGTYVTSIAFSRDGKTLVVGNDDKAVRLYDVATGDLKRALDKHFNQTVQSVAFNPDGNILAVGVADGFIKLWQYPEVLLKDRVAYWEQQDADQLATWLVAFSPDNRTLARIGLDGIKLYHVTPPGAPFQPAAPRLLIKSPGEWTQTGPKVRFTSLAFKQDSRILFAGGSDGLIYLYDADSGKLTGTYKGHNDEVRGLAFNATGSQLASAGADYTARLWNFDVVLQARDFTHHTDAVWAAAFSPDGQRFVSASADKSAKVVAVGGGKVVHTLSHSAGVTNVAWSPDGKRIASAGGDKVIKLWNADTGELVKSLEGHHATITAIDFSADSSKLAVADADKRVNIWNVAGKGLVTLNDHPSIAAAVAFSPDGKWLATGSIDQMIRVYDAASGKPGPAWSAHGASVTGLSFSPNGQYLASCGYDYLVRVWPFAGPKGEPLSTLGTNPITLSGHSGPLSGVAFRRDNQHLVSCGGDMTLKLWRLESGAAKEMQTYRGHRDWITGCNFSRDGFFIVSASVDRSVKIWEITSREIPLLAEHTGAVEAVAVSPNGRLIASAGTDRTIKLWDRTQGLEAMTLHGHTDAIHAVGFTPDGKTLVSSSEDRSIRLWDVATGAERVRQPGHLNHFNNLVKPVPYFVIAPDNKTLFIWLLHGERGSTIKALDLDSGEELFSFNDSRNILTVSFSANGKRAALGARDGLVRIWDLEKKGVQLPGGDWLIFDKGTSLGDLALTPDGNTLVATSEKGDIKILDVGKRTVLHTLAKAHERRITACLVSPDGKRFATVGQDNVVKLFDMKGEALRQWDTRMPVQDRGVFVYSIAFTPDNRELVTANSNTTLFVLELP